MQKDTGWTLQSVLYDETHAKRASTIASWMSKGTLLGLADKPYSGYSLVDVFHGNPGNVICTQHYMHMITYNTSVTALVN